MRFASVSVFPRAGFSPGRHGRSWSSPKGTEKRPTFAEPEVQRGATATGTAGLEAQREQEAEEYRREREEAQARGMSAGYEIETNKVLSNYICLRLACILPAY
jgi:flagellar biosynthesis/type III secretory pathway protein FliH